MRILVVSPLLPRPPLTGGALRVFHLVRALATEHEVTLLASVPWGAIPGEVREALAPVSVWGVPAGWAPGEAPSMRKRLLQLRSLVSRRSALFWTFAGELQQAVRAVPSAAFDAIQVEYSVLGLLAFPAEVPVVVDAHNLEYRALFRTALYAPWWRRGWLEWDARRVRQDEEAAWRRADLCLATSPVDAAEIARVARRPVAVVPNGVDLDAYEPADPALAERDRLVFVGTFRYLPNVDGVQWFVREVWPRIRAVRPSAQCSLVGFDPPAAVQELAAVPGIEVVGTVADVRPWLARASVVVVPLRSGSGTRLKILEAFAIGRPVVSTPVGAEGLAVEDGRHLLVAEDPVRFADAVLRLLGDIGLQRSLAAAARRLVESEYAWQRIGEKLLASYQALERGRRGRPT
ncbi:MAG: glycosyltransferase family 4 protein [Thermomicrobium sp.]|nr:glycosyltransferase family 4 protein [Thermomicrobium sp.]